MATHTLVSLRVFSLSHLGAVFGSKEGNEMLTKRQTDKTHLVKKNEKCENGFKSAAESH